MPELPYMPFHVANWVVDTEHLSPDAYKAYHMLLCKMWLVRSNCLPDEPTILRTRAGVSAQKWPHVWPQIAGLFEIEDGQVHSKTLGKVRAKARAKHYARSQAGRKGAEAKWLKNKGSDDSNANGDANDKRYSNKNKTSLKERGAINDLFIGTQTIGPLTVDAIREGKRHLLGSVTAVQARAAIEAGMVTEDQCRKVGIL